MTEFEMAVRLLDEYKSLALSSRLSQQSDEAACSVASYPSTEMIKSYSILLCSFLYLALAAENATDGERVARQTFYNPYLYRPGFYSQISKFI